MEHDLSGAEFEPQYVFNEQNILPFAIPYLRHMFTLRHLYREPERSSIIYGDSDIARNYAEVSRAAGFKTYVVSLEEDLVRNIRTNTNILTEIIIKINYHKGLSLPCCLHTDFHSRRIHCEHTGLKQAHRTKG